MNEILHPVTVVLDELIEFFSKMNFQLKSYTEVRTLSEEFESVQIYKENPVRDKGRTFYIDEEHVLQAHTSALRNTVEKCGAGKYLVPGRIYRVNREDPSHNYISHQLEGCIVGGMCNMLEFHIMMCDAFFSLGFTQEQLCYTNDFTIFTSPTIQYYYKCYLCRGKGCSLCKEKGMLAYAAGGIQNDTVTEKGANLSFCISLDRLAMLKYKLQDARILYQR